MVSNIDFGPRGDAENRKHEERLAQEERDKKAHAAQMKAKAAEDAAAAVNALPQSATAQDLAGLEPAQPGSPFTVTPNYADQHPERFPHQGQRVKGPEDLQRTKPPTVITETGPQALTSPTAVNKVDQGHVKRIAPAQKAPGSS